MSNILNMNINRRNLLFGSAATLGVIALAPYLEPIAFQGEGYKKRVISALSVGGLADGEEAIIASLKRWPLNTTMFQVSLSPRSAYRWQPMLGCGPIFTDKSLMLIEATGGCPSQIVIDGHDDGVGFMERYSFPSGSKERWVMS